MLSADDVWAGEGVGWLGSDTYPDEELLAGLGAAARLFPALEEALAEAAPAEVALDTAGALRFLRDEGPLLAGAGFGVLLPDWARKARLGLKLTTRSTSAATSPSARQSTFGLTDLVEFRYDLAVGDQVLSAAELAELAALKVPLVRVRGQWVELDDRQVKAALKFLERKRSGTMTAGEAILIGVHGAGDDVPLTAVDADGWLGDLLSGGAQAERRLAPRPPRTASTASCDPTRSGASAGSRSSATSASGRAWPTTWAWARRSSCWRWSSARAPVLMARRCWCVPCRW